MSPAKLRLMIDSGALPGRKPGSLARSWMDLVAFSVSSATAAAGIVISSSCLQPSSNANSGIPRRVKDLVKNSEYQKFARGWPKGRGEPYAGDGARTGLLII